LIVCHGRRRCKAQEYREGCSSNMVHRVISSHAQPQGTEASNPPHILFQFQAGASIHCAVRQNDRFSARILYRTFTLPTRIPAVQYTRPEKQRSLNQLLHD
jgi:hypothetical protein